MLAWIAALGLAVLCGVRLTGTERGTVMVLIIGLLPLTLLPAYGLLALAVAWRRRGLAVLSGSLVVAHLLVVAPSLGAEPQPAGGTPLRVVVANLYVLNPDPEQAGRFLRGLGADVVVIPELNGPGLTALKASGLTDDLPYVVAELGPREETVGLLSRLPLTNVTTRRAGGRELPRGTVTVGGVDVRLLAAHPLPPISVFEHLWRRSLADLAAEVRATSEPAVVLGDFNSDRDHGPFRELLRLGLRDAHDERGRGLARTWPAGLPLLHLDHVLVRDGTGRDPAGRIAVRGVREVALPGSDHLAVVADLAVLPG